MNENEKEARLLLMKCSFLMRQLLARYGDALDQCDRWALEITADQCDACVGRSDPLPVLTKNLHNG